MKNEILTIDEKTSSKVLIQAIKKFDNERIEAIGLPSSKGFNSRNISWILKLGQQDPLVINYINARKEVELRTAILFLDSDHSVLNIRRYEKEGWGLTLLFEKHNVTYMLASYDVRSSKTEIYVHDPNELDLNKTKIKIKSNFK